MPSAFKVKQFDLVLKTSEKRMESKEHDLLPGTVTGSLGAPPARNLTASVLETDPLDEARAAITGNIFRYIRVGYDMRRMCFSADELISVGAAMCETSWSVRAIGTEIALEIYDHQKELTVRLHCKPDGSWEGRWERHEQMPVLLTPVYKVKNIRVLMLQQADGDFVDLLHLTHDRHSAYASRHAIDFWSVQGEPQLNRDSTWSKILLIRQVLELHYELVVWMDADTLIVRPEEDVRNALQEFENIGMCKHPRPWGTQSWHFNAGIMFIRNCPLTRDFFRRVWEAGPVTHPWQDQLRILELTESMPDAVQGIDDKWNSTIDCNPSARPVIKAWHGYKHARERAALIGAELTAGSNNASLP